MWRTRLQTTIFVTDIVSNNDETMWLLNPGQANCWDNIYALPPLLLRRACSLLNKRPCYSSNLYKIWYIIFCHPHFNI